MRVHFFSPPPSVPEPQSVPLHRLMHRTGGNTGNLLFIASMVRQVAHTEATFGYRLDARQINGNVDLLVIPAANWLGKSTDLGVWYEQLRPIEIPVVIAGLGAQAGLDRKIPELHPGSRAFLKWIQERVALIGTRGDFTTRVLEHYGVRNVATVGCPSQYYHCCPDFPVVREVTELREERVILQATKHHARPEALHRPGEVSTQRRLLSLIQASRTTYVLQSEREEVQLLLGGVLDPETRGRLQQYYEVADLAELRAFLDRMKVFFEVEGWMSCLSGMDFVCGSRIHGVMASLLGGTPAVLLFHDSRTAEMAEFAGLPRWQIDEFLRTGETGGTMRAVEEAAERFDAGEFRARYGVNYDRYKEFLERNQVDHLLG